MSLLLFTDVFSDRTVVKSFIHPVRVDFVGTLQTRPTFDQIESSRITVMLLGNATSSVLQPSVNAGDFRRVVIALIMLRPGILFIIQSVDNSIGRWIRINNNKTQIIIINNNDARRRWYHSLPACRRPPAQWCGKVKGETRGSDCEISRSKRVIATAPLPPPRSDIPSSAAAAAAGRGGGAVVDSGDNGREPVRRPASRNVRPINALSAARFFSLIQQL